MKLINTDLVYLHTESVDRDIRWRLTSPVPLSLFPRSCKGFMHMKFTQSGDGRYVLGENSPPFSTIPEVIHHYTTHKLPIRSAEHMSLLYPVIVQTLWRGPTQTLSPGATEHNIYSIFNHDYPLFPHAFFSATLPVRPTRDWTVWFPLFPFIFFCSPQSQ